MERFKLTQLKLKVLKVNVCKVFFNLNKERVNFGVKEGVCVVY